jgi:phenylpropionate dioxygenase-like ring-hydroxylating dioxygenase large terminal subunit
MKNLNGGPVARSMRDQAERAMRHAWFPVARSMDIQDKPVTATLLGVRLAVFRGRDGQARVLRNRCPHRGGSLGHGKVWGDDIACSYHGWRFSGADGTCSLVPSLGEDQTKNPPKARVAVFPVIERYGHIWTALEEPAVEMYAPQHWDDVDYQWLAAEPIHSETGVAVAIENFRDVAHFPFVHEVSMGHTPEEVLKLDVVRDGLDITMNWPLAAGEGDWGNQGNCMMHYLCTAPGFASITYEYEQLGRRIVAGFPSPVAYDQVKIFWAVANEAGFRGDPIDECLRVEELVYLEDVPVVAELEPREVPWDREYEEYSAPSDHYTLNYRRAFKEFIARVNAMAPSEQVPESAPA